MKTWALLVLMTTSLFYVNCSNNEQKKLGEAQACLDKAGDNSSAASACLTYLEGLSSTKVDAMKCSIKFVAGGITTTRLINAIKQINDGQNKQDVFISILVFNGKPAATGAQAITNVNDAAADCNASQVEGLQYLANFAVAGTVLIKAFNDAGGTVDWNDPSGNVTNISSADLTTAVSNCASGTNCDTTTVGSAIISLSDSYCNGANATSSQCQQVNAALAAGGSDPAAVGQEFFNQISQP